jgi:lysophospholipase L1-like esterase
MANTSLKCAAAASEIAIGVKNQLRGRGPIADKFSANLAQLLRQTRAGNQGQAADGIANSTPYLSKYCFGSDHERNQSQRR